MSTITRILIALIGWATAASAATYYVRTDGSDSNAGTANTSGGAWLTVQKAANTITAGDTVLVQSGTYSETVTVDSGDGSSGSPKVFIGVGNPTVTKWDLRDAYVTVSGFAVSSSTADATGIIMRAGASFALIRSNLISVKGIGIEVHSAAAIEGYEILSNTITNCNKGMILYAKASAVGQRVASNEVVRLNQHGTTYDCDSLRILGGPNWTITRNWFHGNNTNDIATSTSGYPHVDALQHFTEGGQPAVTNVAVVGNWWTDHMACLQVTGSNHGWWLIASNAFGRGLPIIYTGTSNGLALVNMDTSLGTVRFERNTAFDQGIAAIWYSCPDVTVRENVFRNVGTSYSFTGTTPGTGTTNITHSSSSPDAGTGDDTSDPLLVSTASPTGPDGIPWTSDDGLLLQSGSPARGRASDGGDLGAFAFPVVAGTGIVADTATVGTLTVE